MNRRTMLKQTGVTIGAVAVGGPMVLMQTGCGENVSFYVRTVIGTLREISPLLPNSAQLIAKAVAVAEDFDKAYREGKFDSATSLFENLAGLVGQVMSSIGIDNPTLKVGLAVAGIAMRAIANLLKSQASNPVVAAAVKSAVGAQSRIALIQRLADSAAIDAAFEAAKL